MAGTSVQGKISMKYCPYLLCEWRKQTIIHAARRKELCGNTAGSEAEMADSNISSSSNNVLYLYVIVSPLTPSLQRYVTLRQLLPPPRSNWNAATEWRTRHDSLAMNAVCSQQHTCNCASVCMCKNPHYDITVNLAKCKFQPRKSRQRWPGPNGVAKSSAA